MSENNKDKEICETEFCEMCHFETPIKNILMVVTSANEFNNKHKTGLWLEEFAIPYLAFIEKGYNVTIASPNGGQAPIDPESENLENEIKWEKAKKALEKTDKLDSIDYKSFDALVLPGGHGPMLDLYNNNTLGEIINDFSTKHKLIAAICHGPAGLLSAVKNGISFVNGKKLTCFTNEEEHYYNKENLLPYYLEDTLKDAGAQFVQCDIGAVNITEDGNLITGQNFQSSEAFAKAIINYLDRT